MNCQIIRDLSLAYPENFPISINLETTIDPFTQSSLYELSQRAFDAHLPYFAFTIAELENSTYSFYDAISYRIGKHNGVKYLDQDPATRLKIRRIFHVAISKEEAQDGFWQASSYPNPLYLSLHQAFPDLSEEKLHRYAFTALNYHVLENGIDKPDDFKVLLQVQKVVFYALYKAAELENRNSASLKEALKKESAKWEDVLSNLGQNVEGIQ